jgi:TetR/AcrR family transcriptional regulator, transcriptional repressor for nem operon
MKYTKKAIATRKRILDCAAEIMFNKGSNRSRLDDVLSAANVQKGNFYYYFKSKDELALTVLRERGKPLIIEWMASLVQPDADPADNLKQLGRRIVESQVVQSPEGHPALKLLFELCDVDDEFRSEARVIFSEMAEVLAVELRKLRTQGRLSQQIDPQDLAAYLLSVITGAIVQHQSRHQPEELARTVDLGASVIDMWHKAA